MKVNPRASYHVEDWGLQIQYSGNAARAPTVVDYPIKAARQWRDIQPLPVDRGVLGEHLRALRLIGGGLEGRTPYIMTVFNPLSLAGRLVESEKVLVQQMLETPDLVHYGLEVITETFRNYTRAILEVGASGIFFATTTWGSKDVLSSELYEVFGKPYDLQVLEAARGAAFNLLHVCGDNDRFFELADYPVQAINWAATSPSNPSIAEARGVRPALVAGISREALVAPFPNLALAEAQRARQESGGVHWMLGPNCSIPPDSKPETIEALKIWVTGGK
jgi:uroporphyrinogen decarboxylase